MANHRLENAFLCEHSPTKNVREWEMSAHATWADMETYPSNSHLRKGSQAHRKDCEWL